MSNNWKESPAIRKVRIEGSRKMATMVDRKDRHEMLNVRTNWRDLLEDSGWEDAPEAEEAHDEKND